MYADANPITLDDLLAVVEADQADHTAVPAGTGSTDSHTGRPEQTGRRWSATRWLVAAATVGVVGVAFILLTREPAPTAALPSTIIENLDEWLLIPLLDNEEAYRTPEGRVGDARPGTYRTRYFVAGFSFTVPNDWENLDTASVAFINPKPPTGDWTEPFDAIFFVHQGDVPPDDDVDAFIERFLEDNVGIEATEPVDVVIGWAPGKTIEISAVDQPVTIESLGSSNGSNDGDGNGLTVSPGEVIPIHIIRVGYETILIYATPAASGNAFYDDAQSVLDSIVWRDLN
ncbi:MAG: hypothetical protein U9N56_04485 [Actinomycetota bacterium]|nr:hypothetical protein [Actinomycetota bacterium]